MDWKTERIIELEKLLQKCVSEFREWNPVSEMADEIEEKQTNNLKY